MAAGPLIARGDLLDGPAVAVGILEEDERAPGKLLDLTDIHPTLDEIGLRDPNIKRAASLQIVFGGLLGAGLGWALAGWFDFSIAIGIVAGAVVGYLIAHVLLLEYGGRSTR